MNQLIREQLQKLLLYELMNELYETFLFMYVSHENFVCSQIILKNSILEFNMSHVINDGKLNSLQLQLNYLVIFELR